MLDSICVLPYRRFAELGNMLARKETFGRLVLAQDLSSDRDLVDFGGAVGQTHMETLDDLFDERHFAGRAQGSVQVQRARRNIVKYLRHQRLDRRDILA